jgi:hypothetical protein
MLSQLCLSMGRYIIETSAMGRPAIELTVDRWPDGKYAITKSGDKIEIAYREPVDLDTINISFTLDLEKPNE